MQRNLLILLLTPTLNVVILSKFLLLILSSGCQGKCLRGTSRGTWTDLRT